MMVPFMDQMEMFNNLLEIIIIKYFDKITQYGLMHC